MIIDSGQIKGQKIYLILFKNLERSKRFVRTLKLVLLRLKNGLQGIFTEQEICFRE